MKYIYTLTGLKDNERKTLDVALDGMDQKDSFKFFQSYASEFDADQILNIKYTGKYE